MVRQRDSEVCVRSSREVTGYHINATDDALGHIEDFLPDDVTWAIKRIVVDTRNWLPGKKVIIDAAAIREVNWARGMAGVDLSREQIRDARAFDPDNLPRSDNEMARSWSL